MAKQELPTPPIGTPNYERLQKMVGVEAFYVERYQAMMDTQPTFIISAINHPEFLARVNQRGRGKMIGELSRAVENLYTIEHFQDKLVALTRACAAPNPANLVDLDEVSELMIDMTRSGTVPMGPLILSKFPEYEDQLSRAMDSGKHEGISLFLSFIADNKRPGQKRNLARFDRRVIELVAESFEIDDNGAARGYLPTQFEGVRLVHIFEPDATQARLFLEVQDLNDQTEKV
ncbi:hypothetical protein A3C59_01285 [Candidatus Daviesbacteria bacterium RIFCSPHIGHO2_02_FULL_36_13]|uniref:Uncharacterized protein n=1 Tax=Candidatus Daviesbacteria bacterium RIFCSPHIGHO2_02_FULL_36_13 TaxID=1797768 RepID=A0A1F5JXE2_9BACT|nr:MAG: hypothetical protein A3C59_01285 [Candidatus Daviesbacteria bacterium RIFCSPHIGHO2_02_FULL_36_13]